MLVNWQRGKITLLFHDGPQAFPMVASLELKFLSWGSGDRGLRCLLLGESLRNWMAYWSLQTGALTGYIMALYRCRICELACPVSRVRTCNQGSKEQR